MNSGNTKTRRGAAVVVAGALLLAGASGCGTDGGVEGADPTPTTDSGVGATPPTSEAPAEEPPDDAPEGTAVEEDPNGEPPEACELLTEDDAAEILGEAVEPGEAYADECWWSTENDLKVMNLIIEEPDLDEWRTGLDNDSWEPVDLGDEGYAAVSVFDSIEFRVDDRVYELNVVFSTSGDPDAAVRAAADVVESRL